MKFSILNKELQPKLETSLKQISPSQVRVKIMNSPSDSYPAIFASLVSDSVVGFFSDNVFYLLPGEEKSVIFIAK